MGPVPNHTGMGSASGPPAPPGIGRSPASTRGPEPVVGDSVDELPPLMPTNGPGGLQFSSSKRVSELGLDSSGPGASHSLCRCDTTSALSHAGDACLPALVSCDPL